MAKIKKVNYKNFLINKIDTDVYTNVVVGTKGSRQWWNSAAILNWDFRSFKQPRGLPIDASLAYEVPVRTKQERVNVLTIDLGLLRKLNRKAFMFLKELLVSDAGVSKQLKHFYFKLRCKKIKLREMTIKNNISLSRFILGS